MNCLHILTVPSVAKHRENWKSQGLLVGSGTLESSSAVFPKSSTYIFHLTQPFHPNVLSKEKENIYVYKDLSSVLSKLIGNGPNWKQSKYPLTREWINKVHL